MLENPNKETLVEATEESSPIKTVESVFSDANLEKVEIAGGIEIKANGGTVARIFEVLNPRRIVVRFSSMFDAVALLAKIKKLFPKAEEKGDKDDTIEISLG